MLNFSNRLWKKRKDSNENEQPDKQWQLNMTKTTRRRVWGTLQRRQEKIQQWPDWMMMMMKKRIWRKSWRKANVNEPQNPCTHRSQLHRVCYNQSGQNCKDVSMTGKGRERFGRSKEECSRTRSR